MSNSHYTSTYRYSFSENNNPHLQDTAMTTSGLITIFCVIFGEKTQDAFSVQIDRDERVSVLKEHILAKNPNYFKGIDARQLSLWYILLCGTGPHRPSSLEDSDMLNPMDKLRKTFPGDPFGGHIHIIVKSPNQVVAPGIFLSFFFFFSPLSPF